MGDIDIQKIISPIAQDNPISNPSTVTNPQHVFYNVIYVFLWVIAIVAVGMLIYGGFTYITSAGEAEKAVKGRKMITGAIIGLILITASLILYNTILGMFG